MTNEMLETQPDDTETKKTGCLDRIFFWTAGASVLFIWNSALSLIFYFNDRIEAGIDGQFPFYYSSGSFIAFLLYKIIAKFITLRRSMIIVPPTTSVIFILLIFLGEFMDPSNAQKYIFLFLILLAGFFNCVLQTLLTGYIFTKTYKEISAFNAGTSASGIFTTVVSMVTQVLLKNKELDQALKIQAWVYVGFVIIGLLFIMAMFIWYILNRLKPEETLTRASSLRAPSTVRAVQSSPFLLPNLEIKELKRMRSRRLSQIQRAKSHEVVESKPTPRPKPEETKPPSMFGVLFKIYDFVFHMVWLYTASMSIFPVASINMKIKKKPFSVEPTLVVLIYNLSDMVGKYAFRFLPLTRTTVVFLLNILRAIFPLLALIIFGGEQPRESLTGLFYLTIPYIVLCSVSNGYLTSALFAASTPRVKKNEQDYNAFWITFALLFGITYGSFTVFVSFKFL